MSLPGASFYFCPPVGKLSLKLRSAAGHAGRFLELMTPEDRSVDQPSRLESRSPDTSYGSFEDFWREATTPPAVPPTTLRPCAIQ